MSRDSFTYAALTAGGLLGAATAGLSPLTPFSAAAAAAGAVLAGASVGGLWLTVRNGRRSAERQVEHLDSQVRSLHSDLEEAHKQLGDMKLRMQLVQQRKNSIEAILHSIRDVVVVTDASDRIILANDAAEALFGFAFDPAGSLSAAEAMKDAGLLTLIQKCRTGRICHVRHEITLPHDGKPAFFDAVLSCVEDAGRAAAVVAVLHDITREKEVAQMKNDFVSHVSHELKTPLASINAYAEMLVDGEAQDEATRQQFCSVIQGQAQRLTRLIEDILNISRIESGLIKVSKDHHSMALVIRDAVEMIAGFAQEKNITVAAPPSILFDRVYIDRDMLSQVVINLLSNAVKYTPAGGSVTVDSQVNEADNRITVTVSDTGVGIPPEAVEHVFDKFYRVEANNKYAKGTGLGLNLVRQIVETVHGGRVFVRSAVGKGSTFGFELPLAAENVKS